MFMILNIYLMRMSQKRRLHRLVEANFLTFFVHSYQNQLFEAVYMAIWRWL